MKYFQKIDVRDMFHVLIFCLLYFSVFFLGYVIWYRGVLYVNSFWGLILFVSVILFYVCFMINDILILFKKKKCSYLLRILVAGYCLVKYSAVCSIMY